MGKHISAAFCIIENIQTKKDLEDIYSKINIGMFFLEKVYKKNYNTRNFNIDEMWLHKFENGTLVLDIAKKLKKHSAFLEFDLRKVFDCAKLCWTNNKDIYYEIFKSSFGCSMHKGFELHLTPSRYIWFERGTRCYSYK